MGTTSVTGLTARQVAVLLNVTRRRVYALAVARGVGRKHGRDWLFTLQDVAQMRERKAGGRRKRE